MEANASNEKKICENKLPDINGSYGFGYDTENRSNINRNNYDKNSSSPQLKEKGLNRLSGDRRDYDIRSSSRHSDRKKSKRSHKHKKSHKRERKESDDKDLDSHDDTYKPRKSGNHIVETNRHRNDINSKGRSRSQSTSAREKQRGRSRSRSRSRSPQRQSERRSRSGNRNGFRHSDRRSRSKSWDRIDSKRNGDINRREANPRSRGRSNSVGVRLSRSVDKNRSRSRSPKIPEMPFDDKFTEEDDEHTSKKRKSKFEDEGDYMSMSFITEKERRAAAAANKLKRAQNADSNSTTSNVAASIDKIELMSEEAAAKAAQLAASLAANWTQQQLASRKSKYGTQHDDGEEPIKAVNDSDFGFVMIVKNGDDDKSIPCENCDNEDDGKEARHRAGDKKGEEIQDDALSNLLTTPIAEVPKDSNPTPAVATTQKMGATNELDAQAKAYAEYQTKYYQWYYQQQQYMMYQQQYAAPVAYKDPRAADPALRRFYGLEEDKDD